MKNKNELGKNAFIYLKNNFDVKSYSIIMNHFEL